MPTPKRIPNVFSIISKSVPRRVTLPLGQTYKSHPRGFVNSSTNPRIPRLLQRLQSRYIRPHLDHAIDHRQTHFRPITTTTTTMTSTMTSSMTSSTRATPTITYQPTPDRDSPLVHCFFDEPTSTWTYIVVDPASNDALVIDPVLEYDPASGTIGTQSVRGLDDFITNEGYKAKRIIETHVHADHASGARALKSVSAVSYSYPNLM